jgi:hypothetical protein
MSTVWPFSRPHVRELIEISTSSLNRGWPRASTVYAFHRVEVLLHLLRRVQMGMAFSKPTSWNSQVFDSTRVRSSAGVIEHTRTHKISAPVPDFRQ